MPPWNTSNRTKSRSRHTARLNLSNSPAQNTAKTLFIGACCGNGDKLLDALNEGLDQFAGLIRKHMLDYEDVSKNLLCTLWESQSDIPPYIERQMETAVQIINSITSKVAVDSRTSIDDIVDQIFDQFDVSTTDRNLHEDVMRHLVFAVIGWSTMLYIPLFRSAGDNFCTASGSRSTDYQTRQSLTESSQRPLGAMLRSHGLMPITCLPESGPSLGLPTLLPVTHLNFFSLSRLGDVSIIWGDELSKHCEFDRYSEKKELHLFRLPSLCAKICLDESSKVLIGR